MAALSPVTNSTKPEDATAAPLAGAPPPAAITPPATRSSKAPSGFKLVKVRKPDGSIVTVKRRLTVDEAAAVNASVSAQTPSPIRPPGEITEIVTVRQPDGTLIKVRRAIQREDTPTPATGKASNLASPPNTVAKPSSPKPTHINTEAVSSVSTTEDLSSHQGHRGLDTLAAKDTENTRAAMTTAPIQALTPEANQAAMQDALDEQHSYFRDRKRNQFKTRLLRGLGAIAGSAVPAIEIGDFMDGDEILSDDDWSVDDEDDDRGDYYGADVDGHDDMSDAKHDVQHGAKEEGTHATDDDDPAPEHDSSGTYYPCIDCPCSGIELTTMKDPSGHITIDAGAAVSGAAMATAAAGTQPAQRQPPTAATTASPGDKEKEKVTYKITAKDLNQMEEQTAAKASRPLQKHWANMTFYVMASLSIILPLLFLRKFS